jgi:fructose-bisphosphate aldolase, class I
MLSAGLPLGKKIRLGRLFDSPTGRTLVLTIDQGLARGVMPGIEDPRKTIAMMVEGKPNAITMHKGLAQQCFYDQAGKVSLILKCTTFSHFHPNYDALVTTVEEAVRLGADAIAMGVLVGGDRQAEMLASLGKLCREAEAVGMPVVTHIYPKGESIPADRSYSLENISFAARAGAELGANVVKTWYTGSPDTFAKVVESCPVPVVVAGGPKLDDPLQVLKIVRDMMDAGAAGLAFGRNVWQYKRPLAMIRALKVLVHANGTVAEAEAELERP